MPPCLPQFLLGELHIPDTPRTALLACTSTVQLPWLEHTVVRALLGRPAHENQALSLQAHPTCQLGLMVLVRSLAEFWSESPGP